MTTQGIDAVNQKIALLDALPVESEQWTVAVNEAFEAFLKLDKPQQAQMMLTLVEALSEADQADILATMQAMLAHERTG